MLSHLRCVFGSGSPLLARLFGGLLLLAATSCSADGCGSRAGTTPLPGGFPTGKAVENAMSVRLSRPGLDVLQEQLGPIVEKVAGATAGKTSFPIPSSDFHQSNAFTFVIDFDVLGTICVGGPDPSAIPPRCVAEVHLGDATFRIDAVTPDALEISTVLPVKIDDTPVRVNVDPGPEVTIHVGYGAGGSCGGPNLERPVVAPKPLAAKITIPLVAETTPPRTGYTKIDVDHAVLDLAAVSADDIRVCADCGPLSLDLPIVGKVNLCNPILNAGFIKTPIVDAVKRGLGAQLAGVLRGALCTTPNAALDPTCPAQSSPDETNTYCVYDQDHAKCVPTLLGTDAHVELGALLHAISPGTTGGLDVGLAAFGPMRPAPGLPKDPGGRTANGATFGLMGGVLPQPLSNCVPQKDIPQPTGIPVPDELLPTVADGAEAPQVGIALAGRFLDYALASVHRSGLLCLGVSTEQFDMLRSGLLSLLVPSLKTLTFDQADAAAAITTRPQEPPTVALGGGTNLDTDPLLTVTLPKLALDFHVWSFDRFVRVFTYTADLRFPVNVQVAKSSGHPNGSLTATIGEIDVQNGALSNADLLLDDPNVVAGAVSGMVGTVSKQLLGADIPPIDLGSIVSTFGLSLEVDTIKKLTKESDDYVGLFGRMTKRSEAKAPETKTQARIVGKRVWKDHMQASTYEHDKLPELDLELSSSREDPEHLVEYSWWIDGGTRSPWSATKPRTIKDGQLFLQGRHVMHVSSRVVGEPQTEDATPAEVPYVIDVLAPFVKVEPEHPAAASRHVAISAWDLVSPRDALVARYRLDDGAFTPWRPAAEIAHLDVGAAEAIEVEVQDEEGNVGTSRQALVRGRPDPTIARAAAGCGCTTPASDVRDGAAALALFALGVFALRRRRGRGGPPTTSIGLTLGAVVSIAATAQGCSCGGEAEADARGSSAPAPTGCGPDCRRACAASLAKGQPGAYLSAAKADDGTIWVAGYNDALLGEGESYLWGDLVVGRYDFGKAQVDWETVDGVPTRTDGTCVPYEPTGWRGGELESGDNVGRWASLQLSAQGQPMVSYYDDDKHRLKFAVNDGGWKIFVLKESETADIGRYGKMTLVDGKPVLAFMQVEPGHAGRSRSTIVLARAKTPLPRAADDFAFEAIAVDENGPCRANGCGAGEACIAEMGACTKIVGGCGAACGDGQACVVTNDGPRVQSTRDDLPKVGQPRCLAKISPIETFPRVLGAHISLAKGPQGLAAVLYDGFHGNLVGLIDRGTVPWERTILDGETGNRAERNAIDTGDVGGSASLTIGPDGTWHVAYVNGTDETLRYLSVVDGTPGRSEIVDDGTSVDESQPDPGGKHLVGDDASIAFDASRGTITIVYADSSSLGLRRAVGRTAGSPRVWKRTSVPRANKWMAFPQVIDDDTVAVWWRQSTRATKSVEGNVLLIGR